MITLDLRNALARAAADLAPVPLDPKIRPTGQPGRYSSGLAFNLADLCGTTPSPFARLISVRLAGEPWISSAIVTGDAYVTVTVTPQALARVATRVSGAGQDCVRSDVLHGTTVPAPPTGFGEGTASREGTASWECAGTWERARVTLAAELTARLGEAAGATVAAVMPGAGGAAGAGGSGPVAEAIAYAGADAVRFALARVIPGKPARIEAAEIARHLLDNPAYAVRYAHARAASGVRWAAFLATPGEAAQSCLPADPADLALLDALSWLPERAAIAARRGRPDEFARYLEELASAAIASSRFTGPADNGRLALARNLAEAARTGLAAGLGLLGVSAPDRL